MDLSIWVVGLIAVVLLIILVKLVAKNAIKVAAVVVGIAALGIYLFVVFGNANEDIKFAEVLTEYTLEDLSNLYCNTDMSETDIIKCECIVQPLLQDMKSRFSNEELNNLRERRIKYAAEIAKSYKNQKENIKAKLKKENSLHLLDEIKSDLKNKSKLIEVDYK
ncbi:MAG: hypothetical protein U9N85_09855 [Bacteroidota bacterium]|nr:hypothetical protein [Bacteroidota bacterium]